MHMRKLAYTAQGDSNTRKTGVANNSVTLVANTRDVKAELFVNCDGRIALTISQIDVTSMFATSEKGLLQKIVLDHAGKIEYIYNEPAGEKVV